MSHNIFVSYKRDDINHVNAFIKRIKAETKESCWIDKKGIESGSQFDDVIKKAIDEAKVVLFMMSDKALLSEWTYRELIYAKEQKKRVVPVTLDGQQSRAWFKVLHGNLDCINIHDEENCQKLFRDIREWLGKRQTTIWKSRNDELVVRFEDGSEIRENNIIDTLEQTIIKIKSKDVFDLKIECGKGLLLEKRDHDDLKPIGKGYYMVKRIQCKTVTNILKEISDRLNLGLTIYSPYGDIEEPRFEITEIDNLNIKLTEEEINKYLDKADKYTTDETSSDEELEEAFSIYQKVASTGDAYSWNRLGILYSNGIGVNQDDYAAYLCFEKASENGSSWGTLNLGYAYLNGAGVEPDIDKARQIFDDILMSNDLDEESKADAYLSIAKSMTEPEAMIYYEKAIEHGSLIAKNYLEAKQDLKENKHNHPFEFVVEDVFKITGRGTVATGTIISGYVSIGEEITIFNEHEEYHSVVTGVEFFRKLVETGMAGDNVGLLLRDIKSNEIHADDTIMHKEYVSTRGIDELRNEIYYKEEKTEVERTISKSKGFSVEFPDGAIIQERKAVDTFIKTLQMIGLERIAKDNHGINHSGFNVVSTEKRDSDDGFKKQSFVDGFYVYVNMNNKSKIADIKKLSDFYSLNLKIVE